MTANAFCNVCVCVQMLGAGGAMRRWNDAETDLDWKSTFDTKAGSNLILSQKSGFTFFLF